ncbi:short-chain dehydrogenase-like protein [Aspergillus ruber CBS 135680]|uniref:Short-chain dehydrogenase-like protein n=1 Tax=Aspergillus ruber (strain CBS 135680) TaxID=1388766 RepID=A0A017SLD5_ASPRC|nr:short-chain dehydrogenase-like protein [Aspergillus ruber CBS 135680]EYE97454.1 short-chain dehydrogenase-like protein [Aspergillus ruber CBS 135680]
MASYLVTGSSKGLNLGICNILASKPPSEVSKVFTSARRHTDALKDLISQYPGRVEFVLMDVTSEESVQKAVEQIEKSLGGKGLDVLINGVGVMPFTPEGIHTMNNLDSTLKSNVLSAHLVTRNIMPFLQKGNLKKVVTISTTLGSITRAKRYHTHMPTPAYKISKAALNMLMVQYSLDYADQGFTFFVVCPGWVKTDLGGKDADLTVEQSANAILHNIFNSTQAETGKFLNIHVPGWENAPGINQYNGNEIPW